MNGLGAMGMLEASTAGSITSPVGKGEVHLITSTYLKSLIPEIG